jgi:hypothetical protein
VYNFTASAGDDPARFLIHFSNVGIDDPKPVIRQIYTFNNILYVTNPGNGQIDVFNLTGQRIFTQEVRDVSLFTTALEAPTGYYMVRLTNQNGVYVSKVFIN